MNQEKGPLRANGSEPKKERYVYTFARYLAKVKCLTVASQENLALQEGS